MKKEISLGKFDYMNSGKRDYEFVVYLELIYNDDKPRFSASCELWNPRYTDIEFGGQSFDTALDVLPQLKDDELFMKIYNLWEKHHLNDMDASANDEQRNAVKEYCENHETYDYDRVCDFLKEKGLFEVIVDGKPCKYGHSWYYREIPEDDLNEIKRLIES